MERERGLGRISRLGALAVAIGAIGYGVASVVIAVGNPSALTFTSWSEYLSSYSSFPTIFIISWPLAVAIIFPAVAVAIWGASLPERRGLAVLGIVFAGVYTAVLGTAYWLQLTFVSQSIVEGNSDGLSLWVMWHPRSFFWAFESFGYFAMGAACFVGALALAGSGASRRGRIVLGSLGPLGVVFLFNEAIGDRSPVFLSIGLVFVWVILTASSMIWLARSLRPEPQSRFELRLRVPSHAGAGPNGHP